MPGGLAELQLVNLSPAARAAIYVPDRGSECPHLDLPAYVEALQAQIERQSDGRPIRMIGFSLGARMAMELAIGLGAKVERLDLVSAAAPLACGVPLHDMAGGVAFRMVRDAPLLFRLMTGGQAVLAKLSPASLMRMIFASAQGGDRELAHNPHFQAEMHAMLAHSLGAGAPGYRREMRHYVRPWEDRIAKVLTPVTLWHGEADNWAPPVMARWLQRQLPAVCAVHMLPGASHYSTLTEFFRGWPDA